MTAWEKLAALGGFMPGAELLAGTVARNTVQRLVGFWAMWHLYGGLKAMVEAGVASPSGVYRQRAEFEAVFHMSVDEFAPDLGEMLRQGGAAVSGQKQGDGLERP